MNDRLVMRSILTMVSNLLLVGRQRRTRTLSLSLGMPPRPLLNHRYIYDFNVVGEGGPDDDESDAHNSSDDDDDERIPDLDESLLPILIHRPVEIVDDDDDNDSLPGLVPRDNPFRHVGYNHD
jgi:hypothetical protein